MTGPYETGAFEPGRNVRWRGARWRVLAVPGRGVVRLVGIEPQNRDRVVEPLLELEVGQLEMDSLGPPEFDVLRTDRARWRALHRAHLVTMAGGREQLVGLDWGAISVEPYQLVPLLRVAKSIRPRLLIADDTGLGKTAEAGIVLRWLAQRHQATRVLVVTRASPEPERWQEELWTKFGLRFDILESGEDFRDRRQRSPTLNVFAQQPHLIVSMTLAARQLLLDELRRCPAPYDVVIVDEAHHLAERGVRTKRLFVLGKALADRVEDGVLMLLTATPHDGKSESLLSLLRLLDPLIEIEPGQVTLTAARRLMVRRLKSEVVLAGGKKFVEPRIEIISTLGFATRAENALDPLLDSYLAWLSAEERRYRAAGRRQNATGCEFLSTVLRKRLGSSAAALRATLRRRLGDPPAPEDEDTATPLVSTDLPDIDTESAEAASDTDSSAPELSAKEIGLARALLQAAVMIPSGRDSKLEGACELLKRLAPEKVVVFTEYRDTLRAAAKRLDAEGIPYVLYHGATSKADRKKALSAFARDPQVRVFLATDAASEGKNLQRAARHLIHLDVPWNPNRYAQRNGRIDRYGQSERPEIWVLVAADRKRGEGRAEYRALELVVEKLKLIQAELGSVSAVLPLLKADNIEDILRRAERNAEEELTGLIEKAVAVNEDFSRLAVQNQAEMREAEEFVRRLGSIDDFENQVGELLRVAFKGWDDGGSIDLVDEGVVRIRVPRRLQATLGASTIDKATFRRAIALAAQDNEDPDQPEFLSPAHPLVEAVLQRLRDEAALPHFPHRFDVEAENPEGLVLTFLERFVDGEGRTLDEHMEAVEVDRAGHASRNPVADLERLGLDRRGSNLRPDPRAIDRWTAAWGGLLESAMAEATRRAEARREELVRSAANMRDDEIETLALWREHERTAVERVTLGTSVQVTLIAGAEYDARLRQLEAEHDRRRAEVRDRSEVRLASVELLGGRLIVAASP